MSSAHITADSQRAREPAGYSEYEDAPGYGWVIFAGIVLMIAGTLNFIYGIAAISSSNFYVAGSHFVISELNTWGWVVMIVGIVQFCVAFGVWVKAGWARWTGVFIAGISAIIQLMFISASPFLALAVFALDLLVIYGLVSYGGKMQEA